MRMIVFDRTFAITTAMQVITTRRGLYWCIEFIACSSTGKST
jgi:hypothetical protein